MISRHGSSEGTALTRRAGLRAPHCMPGADSCGGRERAAPPLRCVCADSIRQVSDLAFRVSLLWTDSIKNPQLAAT